MAVPVTGIGKMRVLLVEPFGHMGGHPTEHTRHLVRVLADAGLDITLLTLEI